jgi:hypothetical protein
MKKETLEEAAKFNYDNKTSRIPVPTSHWINSEFLQIQNFKEGVKWQQERSYSEKDMKEAFEANIKDWICFEEFIDTFKKK